MMILRRRRAFSLVEVVLAIGVISFALVVLVALFGSLLNRYGEVRDRRDVLAAVSALNTFLSEEISFDQVYSAVQQSPLDLIFTQYRVNDAGQPDSTGSRLQSRWFSAANPPDPAVEAAREGRWIKARLQVDQALNPVVPLPSGIGQYTDPRLLLSADIYVVPFATAVIPGNFHPALSVPLVVVR